NVIDADILQDRRSHAHRYLGEETISLVFDVVDVVDRQIMNAVALPGQCDTSIGGNTISHLQAAAHVADLRVANRNIGDFAERTDVGGADGLVLRTDDHPESGLGEPAPGIFQNVAFEENALRVLQFEQVLDNKRLAVPSANKA